MMPSRLLEITVILTLLGSAIGQAWQSEVNVSICNWAEFRASVINDTVYLDGGSLWWQIGLTNGQYQDNDGSADGVMYALNLGQPFGPTTNLTALFKKIPKIGGTVTESIAPDYIDGVMFANDYELILYGGLTQVTNSTSPPPANSILEYEAYQNNQEQANWQPTFTPQTLPSNVTRYITNGAGVSVPSENLGFYFSGMRGADWGLIENGALFPNTTANTLISVDMSVTGGGTWTNDTLPSKVLGRANAELVWIPVSSSGILIATGGVIDAATLTAAQALTEQQAAASNKTSPTFMETVSVYDIATKTWFLQNTTGEIPPQLTLFCSVVAAASDGSSYNIYIYGGYDGVDAAGPVSDDVYILSVPSFTWVKAYDGGATHGRSGHKCIKTYPDQMFVLGGIFMGNSALCLDGGIIQVFNLNTLEFQDSYSPEIWSNYTVPSPITDRIGGNGQGGATKTAPSIWNEDALATVFRTMYTGTIPAYSTYPLVNGTSTPTPNSTVTPTSVPNAGSAFPGWAGAVLGVVLGLAIVAGGTFILAVTLRRRARTLQGSMSESRRGSFKPHILKWLYGMPPPTNDESSQRASAINDKATSETAVDPSNASPTLPPVSDALEADSSAIHELESPEPRFELPTEYNYNASETPIQEFPSPTVDEVARMPTSPITPHDQQLFEEFIREYGNR